MRLDGVFPDAAPSPGLSARAAAVLGWCSPKSSVPRQTVGHHARAANYEMGPTAACEGCRGEVPRRLDIPPTGAFFSFPSYTHRPGRSGAHEPAGSGVDFRIPQNSFVWRWLKMGSRARTRGERPAPTAACPGRRCRGAPVRPTLDPGRPALYPGLPTRLPYTPDGPTLYLALPRHIPQPACPILYGRSYIHQNTTWNPST